VVQFYEDDAFLCRVLTDFAAAGLDAAETVVLVAEHVHRETVARDLRARGFDVDAAAAGGALVMLDAREALSGFMVDGMPAWDPFASRFHCLLDAGTSDGRRARVYGEMVDVLWQDGNHRAAIRLEEMWNALLETAPVPLLCGYSMDGFVKASDAEGFRRVCEVHAHVRPMSAESSPAGAGVPAPEVGSLERRARALEDEIRHRHELEIALRQALDREQDAHRAKDRLLALLGHELRNPLGAIVLALDLMRPQLGNAAARERQVIETEVRTLVRLVDDLLSAAGKPLGLQELVDLLSRGPGRIV